MTKRTANVVVTVKSAEGRSSGGQVPGASEAARAMAARLRARIEDRAQPNQRGSYPRPCKTHCDECLRHGICYEAVIRWTR